MFEVTGEEMRFFCSAIRKVGLAAEPGFTVSSCPACLDLELVVAPETKCSFELK